ncbi:hypothetical protein [Bradyrhizobium sp. LB13.1]
MKSAIERRLVAIEKRRQVSRRQVHVVLGVDRADVDQQVVDLFASGVAVDGDGFACITGQPKSENPGFPGLCQ